jgi:large subunit ribosomal protein L10
MEKAQKVAAVEELTANFTQAQIAICGDYRGLTVAQMTKLRKELKKAGATSVVVRNTLGRISAKNANSSASSSELERFVQTLKGPSFVIFSKDDPIAPTKALAAFLKEKNNEKFKVKGAWFEGAYVDAAGVDALSKMPGRAEVMASLLRVILAPATQLVRLINEPGSQVVRVIDAQRQNLEKQ